MTRVALSAILLVVCACASREPLPVSHADSSGDEAPAAPEDALANDPVRLQLRTIHTQCDGAIGSLAEGVDDADRREDILTAVAALAYVVGTVANGNHDPAANQYGPDNHQECVEGSGGRREGRGCGFQPMPSRSLGEGGPVDEDTDQVHRSAAEQIRLINRNLDAVDELILSAPDSSTWTDEQRENWNRLRLELTAACGR